MQDSDFSFADFLMVSPSTFNHSQHPSPSSPSSPSSASHSSYSSSANLQDRDGFMRPALPPKSSLAAGSKSSNSSNGGTKSKPLLQIDTMTSTSSLSYLSRMSPRLGSPITPTSPSVGVFLDSPRCRRGYGGFYIPQSKSPLRSYSTDSSIHENSPFKSNDIALLNGMNAKVAVVVDPSHIQRIKDHHQEQCIKKRPLESPSSPSPALKMMKNGGNTERIVKLERKVVLGKWKKRLKQSLDLNPHSRSVSSSPPRTISNLSSAYNVDIFRHSISGKQGPPKPIMQSSSAPCSLAPKVSLKQNYTPDRFAKVTTADDLPLVDSKVIKHMDLISDEVEVLLKGFAFEEALDSSCALFPSLQQHHQQVGKEETFAQPILQTQTHLPFDFTNFNSYQFTADEWPRNHHDRPQTFLTPPKPPPSISTSNSLALQLTNMAQHQNTNDKPFLCPVENCNHEFSRRHDLLRHLRIHTQEKPYRCNRCFKAFTRLDALKKHELVSIKYDGQCRIKRGRVPKSVSSSLL